MSGRLTQLAMFGGEPVALEAGPGGVAGQVLAHLRAGNTITPLEALQMFGCLRLAARIHELRRLGHRIEVERAEAGGKRFARYRLG